MKKRVVLCAAVLLAVLFAGCSAFWGELPSESSTEDDGGNGGGVGNTPKAPELIVHSELVSAVIHTVGLSTTGPEVETVSPVFVQREISLSYGQEKTFSVPPGTYYFYAADTNTTSGRVYIKEPSLSFANDQTVTITLTGSDMAHSTMTTGTAARPAAPDGLIAAASSLSVITLSWNAVSGAEGYYVYRADSAAGTYAKVSTVTSPFYTDTGLSANATYYYKVSAYNDAGESAQSAYTSATTSSSGPLSVPTGAVALSSGTWASGSISSGEVKYYYFTAAANTAYAVTWDDSFDGSGIYTADIVVTAYRNNVSGTMLLFSADASYTTPQFIPAYSSSSTIILEVEPYSSYPYYSSGGSFRIKYESQATLVVHSELTSTVIHTVGLSPTGPGQTVSPVFIQEAIYLSGGQEQTFSVPLGTFYFFVADTSIASGSVRVFSPSHEFRAGVTAKVTVSGSNAQTATIAFE